MKSTTQTTPPAQAAPFKLTFESIGEAKGHRTLLYGPGGIGKSTLAAKACAIGKTVFIDWEESLPKIKGNLVKLGIEVPRVVQIKDYKSLRLALQSAAWGDTKNIVVDSVGRLEEIVISETLRTIKNDKSHNVQRLEDYGFGKGFQHVYEVFLPVLADFDRICRQGVNVILIAHDCTSNVPNPEGEDWIRYEPRLQHPTSGKGSVRLRVKEWADHVLYYGYDVAVDEEGKAKGHGSKTIYTSEMPYCMAKSRTLAGQFPQAESEEQNIWQLLFAK